MNQIIFGVEVDITRSWVGFHCLALYILCQLLLPIATWAQTKPGKGGGLTSSSHLPALKVMIGAIGMMDGQVVLASFEEIDGGFEIKQHQVSGIKAAAVT